MNRFHTCLLTALILFLSAGCNKFLEEDPTGFIPTSAYYKTESQIQAAVNGAYLGLDDMFTSDIGVAVSPVFSLEYVTGYSIRPRPGADQPWLDLKNLINTDGRYQSWWNATYYPLENCNSAIANISNTTIIDDAAKNKYLGQLYFLRAWYYFQGVRLFGSIPLKTTPTTSLSDIQPKKASVDSIYKQIVSDLTQAEASGLPWTDVSGHASMGAVKALLAKVYLTMAGYPLQKGSTYYQKAYDKAKEVVSSGKFRLFDNYADLRDPSLQNTGEHIFMLQHDLQNSNNFMHFFLMPYPEQPVSINYTSSGGLAPSMAFYDSYEKEDLRIKNKNFYYTELPQYNNPNKTIKFTQPYIYKYWDDAAESTGKSGANFSLIRYADVLLDLAEAKASLDGGSTSDASALEAYYEIHHRAFPASGKPGSISFDQVYKERMWETAFEFKTWYDMIRTRKAFDVKNNKIVDLIGYKAPTHLEPFKQSDLLFLIPYNEIQKNPNLK